MALVRRCWLHVKQTAPPPFTGENNKSAPSGKIYFRQAAVLHFKQQKKLQNYEFLFFQLLKKRTIEEIFGFRPFTEKTVNKHLITVSINHDANEVTGSRQSAQL